MRTIYMAALLALPLAACGSNGGESEELAQAKLEAAEAKLEAAEAKLAASEAGEDEEDEAEEKTAAKKDKTEAPAKSASASSAPTSKSARCKIIGKMEDYDGPCRFISRGGGSFTVKRDDGGDFFNDMTEVMLDVTGKGTGRVSVRQMGSVTSFGTMTRSSSDSACWEKESFEVCAY